MNRITFCLLILVLVIAFCGTSLYVIRSGSERLCSAVEEIQILSEQKKTAEALAKCEELNRTWTSYYHTLSFFVKGDKLSGINSSIAKIKPYLESDNDELNAELDSILYQTRWIWETEFPYFYNVF